MKNKFYQIIIMMNIIIEVIRTIIIRFWREGQSDDAYGK